MVDKVTTLFGDFDEKQLRSLKGYVDELVVAMTNQKSTAQSMADIIALANDELKIPKKIIRKMAKIQYNQSLPEEVAEFKELEALIEGIKDVR